MPGLFLAAGPGINLYFCFIVVVSLSACVCACVAAALTNIFNFLTAFIGFRYLLYLMERGSKGKREGGRQ